MRGKTSAVLWSIIQTFTRTKEETILLKYNESFYLFWINLISGIFVLSISLFFGIKLTFSSSIILIIYAFAMVGGGFCYIKAVQKLPLGLVCFINAGDLFLIFLCDLFLGYIKLNVLFLVLFFIFFISIYIFSTETNKMKSEITFKKIDLKAIFILIASVIFYASEPYFVKLANSQGANEYGINIVYYMVAIPVFYYLYQKKKKTIPNLDTKEKTYFFKNILLLGLLFAISDVLAMIAYIDASPIIVIMIFKLKVFLVVIASVIRKTDKMNWKKVISLITGMMCIFLMTLLN